MFGAARPGMGTGDSVDLGRVLRASRGTKNFLPDRAHGKKCSFAEHLRQFKSWRICEDTPDQESDQRGGARMSKLLRKPEAVLWVLSISQAAAMLALNLLL